MHACVHIWHKQLINKNSYLSILNQSWKSSFYVAVSPPPWEAALCVWPRLGYSAWGNLIQPFGTTWSRHRRPSSGSSLLHRIAALPLWTASILKMQWHNSTALQVPRQLWPLCIAPQWCKELPCPDFCFYRHQLLEKPGIVFQDLNSSHFWGGWNFFLVLFLSCSSQSLYLET